MEEKESKLQSICNLAVHGENIKALQADIKAFLNKKKQMGDNSKSIAKDDVTSPQPIKFSVNVKVEKCDDDSKNKNGPVEEVVNYGGTFNMDECGVNISEPTGINAEKDLEVLMNGLKDDGSNSKEDEDDIIILDDGRPLPVVPNESEECDIYTLQAQLDAEIQKDVEMEAALYKVFKASNCYRRFLEKETQQPLEDNLYDDDDDLTLINNSDEVAIISQDNNEYENYKEFLEDNVKIINSKEKEESNTNRYTKVKEEPKDDTNISCRKDATIEAHSEHNAKVDTLIIKDNSVIENYNVKESHSRQSIIIKREKEDNTTCSQNEARNTDFRTEMKEKLKHDNIRVDDIVMFHPGGENVLHPQEVHYNKVNKIAVKGPVCDAALSCGKSKRRAKKKCTENLKSNSVTGEVPVSDKRDSGEPIEKKRDVSIVKVDIYYACKKCEFRGCYNEYIEHITSSCVAMSFSCSTCYKAFPTLKLYVRHLTQHNYNLACPNCKQQFKEVSKLCSHIKLHLRNFYMKFEDVQNMDLSTSQNYHFLQCIECKKIIKSEQIFNHWDWHLKMKNYKRKADDYEDSVDEAEMNSKLTKKVLDLLLIKEESNILRRCIVCNKTFSKRDDCKRHSIIHLLLQALKCKGKNNNQLRCQLCGADQNNETQYKQHMRGHASVTIYKCRICAKTLSNSSSYSKHMKRHNTYSYICDRCDGKFGSKKRLIKHLQLQKSRPPAICLQCDISFCTESNLKTHFKAKHMRGCSSFLCMICKKRFWCIKDKWDHMWLEHQERKVEADCSLCNMKFRKLFDVKQHMRAVHFVTLNT